MAAGSALNGTAVKQQRTILGTVTNITNTTNSKSTTVPKSKVTTNGKSSIIKEKYQLKQHDRSTNRQHSTHSTVHVSINKNPISVNTDTHSTDTSSNGTGSGEDTEIEEEDTVSDLSQELSPVASVPSYKTSIVCRGNANPHAVGPIWTKKAIEEQERLHQVFSQMPGVFDDDDEDTFDISMAVEYNNEIFHYMRDLEFRYLPDANYISRQTDLTWRKRSMLVDWLVRVHEYCGLLPETLFLCIHYVDRFLSLKSVNQDKLQLVGIVALFVAAKYEEVTFPTVQEFASLSHNEYSTDEILKAERYMINLLDFNLGWPGPMSFLRRSSKADDYDNDTRTLSKYFLEIALMDERFVGAPPSWISACSHYLSRKILGRGKWSSGHVYFSGYNEEQLQPGVEILVESCKKGQAHHKAVYSKYGSERFKWASLHVADWITEFN